MIRAVIIEDEMHSRETLKHFVQEFCQDVTLCGTAASVEEALLLIRQIKPDLVFLDIELQTSTGFDLLRQLQDLDFDVIFTTAFEQYAIQAIKFSSLDYLLKPIDIIELQAAVTKAVNKQDKDQSKLRLEHLLQNLETRKSSITPGRICLSTTDGLEFVELSDILYCEANGSYTNFYLRDGRKTVVSKHLKEYEILLSDYTFMRVHNSYLINLREVQRYIRTDGGYILMKNSASISISPKRRDEFLTRMTNLQ